MSERADAILADLSDADRRYLYVGWGSNFATRVAFDSWRAPSPAPSRALLDLCLVHFEYHDSLAATLVAGVVLTERGREVLEALLELRAAQGAVGRKECPVCKGSGKLRGFRGVRPHCQRCEGTGLV